MATTKPQWATPERQEHLVRLFIQYHNRCKLGHAMCPDLRHHYQGCAAVHENVRTEELRRRIQVLENRELAVTERERIIALALEQDKLNGEVTRLRENCSIVEHYFEHLARAMFEAEPIEIPLTLYQKRSEGAIEAWKAEDREERSMLRKLEQQQIQDGTYGRYGSDFDPVARDVHHQERPEYYLLGFGVSAESKKRIAVIRVPSTYIRLYVQVSEAFQGVSVSRNKRRKMARYQSDPPAQVWAEIDRRCAQAVRDFWAGRSQKPVS